MNPEIQAGHTDAETVRSLLQDSVLIGDEAKSAIHSRLMTATDSEFASRLVAFLREEKTYIVEFLKRRLHDGSFPNKVPILLHEMRAGYLAELRKREILETDAEPRAEDCLVELATIL